MHGNINFIFQLTFILNISFLIINAVSNVKEIENSNFCIQNELSEHAHTELGKNGCEILAVTLTDKEKENFVKTVCQDIKDTRSIEHFYYFRLRNGELTGRGVHNEICEDKTNPFLAWLPYKAVQHNYLSELNPTEHLNYIAKATDTEKSKTELCHFQHSDLVANSSTNLSNCITLVYQDFFPLGDNIDVLVEIQPILYELSNITYLPWSNMSLSYKTMLGETVLKNRNSQKKQIFGGLTYKYTEKLKLNLTSVYGDKLEKLPILIEYKNASLEVNEKGLAIMPTKEKAYFGRVLFARSSMNVGVVGQWSELGKQFSADVYEYFGHGIRRFREQIHHVLITFERITSTEPIFEELNPGMSFERLKDIEDEFNAVTDEVDIDPNQEPGYVYPNFYYYSIIACIIVGGAFLIAIGSMVRTCDKERELRELEQQKKYHLTSTDIN